MRVHDVAKVVRRVLRGHVLRPEPDPEVRAMTCSCGLWLLGLTYGDHLLHEFDGAGLQLTPKDDT